MDGGASSFEISYGNIKLSCFNVYLIVENTQGEKKEINSTFLIIAQAPIPQWS